MVYYFSHKLVLHSKIIFQLLLSLGLYNKCIAFFFSLLFKNYNLRKRAKLKLYECSRKQFLLHCTSFRISGSLTSLMILHLQCFYKLVQIYILALQNFGILTRIEINDTPNAMSESLKIKITSSTKLILKTFGSLIDKLQMTP